MSSVELGFFAPSSITWKIHSDPAMLIGGIRALFQQALHPQAMAGVAEHSNFREDAWGRLQRTGDYVSTLTFGTPAQANELTARVRKIHSHLGLDDPKLLLWVHMAMVDSFLDVAVRSGLTLTNAERDQYVAEMVLFAQAVGIDESIVSQALKVPLDIVEEDGLDVYHHILKEGEREYLLRVYVNSEKIPPLVVTVYKTSKIKKYLP